MTTIRHYIKIYFLIISQYIKARMQFRVDFFISTIAIIISNVSGILSLAIIFSSISSLEGWSYFELLFIYSFAILSLTPVQLLFDNVWQLNMHVRNGSFIKYYFKPLNMMFYYMSEVFDLKGLGQLLFGIVVLIYSSVKLNFHWSIQRILLLLLTIFSSSLIMVSLLIISASISFWIINSHSFIQFVSRFREFAYYPMTIFNRVFRFIFTFLIPIGFISFYPSQLFIGEKGVSLTTVLSPFVGIIMFFIAYRVWLKGTRVYSGTGS